MIGLGNKIGQLYTRDPVTSDDSAPTAATAGINVTDCDSLDLMAVGDDATSCVLDLYLMNDAGTWYRVWLSSITWDITTYPTYADTKRLGGGWKRAFLIAHTIAGGPTNGIVISMKANRKP